ncbi:hypothetical protein [Klebsiella pneumoniae]|jgi:hypothetical protein|uniref:Uncharacterized protein n=1 Tax=Klebsiella pneumoniae TaxID=573 RepID=A0A486NI71_KLEPN|nr:hypothetical protein [Klebsiella pneumoniae]EKJ7697685.1 hypothetical protein [Klebsiella pneumoniae]MCV6944875.1 hypothetical protein [Klebsiella pneumoniae]VFZ94265.1 Uncharacterised protein [Klebsiella pneumoniae]VGK09859.1 Uncharacterised protein [Klebsiella pneumoniae]VGK44420.1 Uncharacterised protein [Klebsiella pneumoniae]
MTITLQAVNELIASLESAGELSIREQKFLKLAKAYQRLAAENVVLKLKGRELLNEASKVYQKYNATIDFYSGDFMDGQTLHEFQFALDAETSATDAFLAGIKADAIDEAAVELDRVDTVASTRVIGFKLREFSQQLREGADK